MRRLLVLLLLGGLAFVSLPGGTASAQNAVVNPGFTTGNMNDWTYSDPSYGVMVGPANSGLDYYACKKTPGSPVNNGSMTQQVHLIGGHYYTFTANVAAKYCST